MRTPAMSKSKAALGIFAFFAVVAIGALMPKRLVAKMVNGLTKHVINKLPEPARKPAKDSLHKVANAQIAANGAAIKAAGITTDKAASSLKQGANRVRSSMADSSSE